MTPQERYRKAIASRPSNEELKYWASLDTMAAEKTKAAFLAELDADSKERNERIKTWMEEYKRQSLCRSNGIDFMVWKVQFEESVKVMSSLNPEEACINLLLACYENDEKANIVALNYVNEHEPDVPDPEMVEQQRQAKEWMENMARADEIHRERLESIRWLPEPEAAQKWNERKYAA